MKKPPCGKPLPPKFKHVITQDFRLTLTLKQRILVLFGCQLAGRFSCWTEHGPGKVRPSLNIFSDETNSIKNAPKLPTA